MHFVTDQNEQPRSDSFAKSCIMYCIDKYEQGLLVVAEEKKKKLWCYYLETLLEMQDENIQTQSIDRETFLRQALEKAHKEGHLEEHHYSVWVGMVPDTEARVILGDATSKYHKHSELLWKLQLGYAIKSNILSEIQILFKSGVEHLKNKALSLWLMFLRYHLLSSDTKKIIWTFEDGVREHPDISNALKPKYIEWIAFHEGIEAARNRYRLVI